MILKPNGRKHKDSIQGKNHDYIQGQKLKKSNFFPEDNTKVWISVLFYMFPKMNSWKKLSNQTSTWKKDSLRKKRKRG